MVGAAWAAALLALTGAEPAWGLEVKVAALVQAGPPGWKEIPPEAQILPGRLSFKRKVFLGSGKGMPVWAYSVKRTLSEVLDSLPAAKRKDLPEVLNALSAWSSANLFQETGEPDCPESWRSAGEVLAQKRGSRFELVRGLVTVLRAAGVPARPTFNGVPLIYLYVTPPGGRGFWTVWDPFSQDESARSRPVLWLPLRAGEIPIVEVDPAWEYCRPMVSTRIFAERAEAAAALEAFKRDGRLPEEEGGVSPDRVSPARLSRWWELWSIGVEMAPSPEEEFSVVFPLPFIQDTGYGTREHEFWVSEPERLRKVHRIHAHTDQQLGGLTISVRAEFFPRLRDAEPGDA